MSRPAKPMIWPYLQDRVALLDRHDRELVAHPDRGRDA